MITADIVQDLKRAEEAMEAAVRLRKNCNTHTTK